MKKLTLLLWLFAGQVANTQSQNGDPGSDLSAALTFEAEHLGSQPRGWGGGPPGTISVDGENVHGGRWSVRLERDANSVGRFSTLTKSIPIDFTGSQIEWRGFLRVDNVSEFGSTTNERWVGSSLPSCVRSIAIEREGSSSMSR